MEKHSERKFDESYTVIPMMVLGNRLIFPPRPHGSITFIDRTTRHMQEEHHSNHSAIHSKSPQPPLSRMPYSLYGTFRNLKLSALVLGFETCNGSSFFCDLKGNLKMVLGTFKTG